jgi:hypothetical protein
VWIRIIWIGVPIQGWWIMGFLLGELAQFFSARKEIANKMIVPEMPSAIGILTLEDTISIVVEHRVKLPR